jgi:O-antigen ligase
MLILLLIVLYACMPVALMSSDALPSAVFYLAFAVAIVLAAKRKVSPRHVLADYRVLLCCYSVPLLVVLASSAVHAHWAGAGVEAGVRTSIGLPVFLLGLSQIRPHRLRQAVWGVYAATFAATAYVLYLIYPSFLERPLTTVYNAVSYGNLMLLMAVVSLYSLLWRLTSRPRLERAVKILAVVAALAGFVLTQTRTGWLAVPVFALLGVAMITGFRRPWRAVGLLAAIVVVVAAIGFSSPSLRERVELGYQETMQCYDTSNPINNSVCIRFQLWRAAWHAFSHNPVLGLGDHGRFRDWMKTRALPDGVVSEYVANNFGEPHNDMMQALSSFGILGGIGLLLMYFAPVWVFVRRMSRRYPRESRVAAAMGAAVCLGFAVFGITELMFRGMRTVGFYTMFVALFLMLSEPEGEGGT